MIKFGNLFKIFIIIYSQSAAILSQDVNLTDTGGTVNNGYGAKLNVKNITENTMVFPPDFDVIASAIEALPYNRCYEDSQVVISSIIRKHQWAMQMFDASPKFPTGILYGSTYQLGNFDECLDIEHEIELNGTEKSTVSGQYCLADMISKKTTDNTNLKARRTGISNTMRFAICVPTSCANEDVATFLSELFSLIRIKNNITINVEKSNCYSKKTKPLSSLELTYGSTILIFLSFICIATLYHIIHLYKKANYSVYSLSGERKSHKGCVHKILLSFSIVRNVGKILQTTSHSKLNLDCISGIKFLCMGFIIPGHTLLFTIGGPVMNTDFYEKAITKIENGLFLNNPLLVDTFLFLSGFLMCYLLLVELDKRNGKLNVLILYIGRYIRLTPSYLVMIGLYSSFLVRLDTGPLWNAVVVREQERCLTSWWSNILYINNYIKTDYLCMFQSWYLAADTQLFFIAPAIIYPLWRYNRCGKILLCITVIATVSIPGFETYMGSLDPTLMIYPSEVADLNSNSYFKNVYIKTHIRASSYCIGLLFGYIIYKVHSSSLKIPTYVNCFGWITSALCAMVSMFSVTVFYQPGHEYNLIEATVYSTFHRIAWCLAIGWIVTACITGNGGVVNKLLSWKLFMPLSRLTYCAYLVNGLIELHALGTIRQPRYMSVYNLASLVTSHLVLTFAAAFILCVLFESPIHSLEKILLQRDKKKQIIFSNNLNNSSSA